MLSVETNKLYKKYGDKIAVNGIDLKIEKGEIYALLGVNGAGKTTTIRMLTGLIKPSGGEATLNGYSINKDIQKIKEIINVSPQETAVAPNLSVKENLEFIADMYQIKDKKTLVTQLLNDFQLEDVENKRTKKLSGGYMRRLSIAMALINDPEIIFLDEPTLGLDVLARRGLWKVIEALKGKKTIILTTHYMEEAELLADHIGIMVDGNLLATGTKDELIKITKAKNFEDAFVNIATGGRE